MPNSRLLLLLLLFLLTAMAALTPVHGAPAARFVKSTDGLTVHDELLHVTWLADANLPATQKFGLPIHASGSMTFQNARKWVAALNASSRGAGFLGHANWTLPATPITDRACSVARGP